MSKILSLESEWVRTHPKRIGVLRFFREAIGVKEVQWSDITKQNLYKVADKVKENVTSNSSRTYFAEICAFLKRYDEEGIIPCKHPEEVLKARKEPQQSVYLTEEEIWKIEDYYDRLWRKYGHQAEKDVLTLFLLETWTGARISDCRKFTADNIRDGKLSYTSQKTSVLTEVPEHRRLRELISRIPSDPYSSTTVNRTLKRVARKCGITEKVTLFTRGKQVTCEKCDLISSHSGRKSFVTNLARRGVDLYTISAFAGHRSTMQTDRYVVRDTVNTPEAAITFFK